MYYSLATALSQCVDWSDAPFLGIITSHLSMAFYDHFISTLCSNKQLESVAKISNLHYIEAFQCIGKPIHWNASIYWVTNTLKCFNILGYQYIEMLQYIANYLFLQRTLTADAIVDYWKLMSLKHPTFKCIYNSSATVCLFQLLMFIAWGLRMHR